MSAIWCLHDANWDQRHQEQEQMDGDAQAGVSEYWIVDPQAQHVVVLSLQNGSYVEHGRFTLGQLAYSRLLEGWSVDVTKLLHT